MLQSALAEAPGAAPPCATSLSEYLILRDSRTFLVVAARLPGAQALLAHLEMNEGEAEWLLVPAA